MQKSQLITLISYEKEFRAMSSGWFKYEVDNKYERHVISLKRKIKNKKCTCRLWDLTRIPCKHGVAAIYKNSEKPKDYLHACYMKEAYLNTYSEITNPMSGQNEWIKTRLPAPIPPRIVIPFDRLKKLRRRNLNEPRNSYKVSKDE